MSSDGSVSRPDFWTASFKRVSSMTRGLLADPFCGYFIATVAAGEKARHAANCRDTDTGQSVYLAIRQPTLQELDDAPAISHRLNFRRRAQIAEESAAFLSALQGRDGRVEIAFCQSFLPGRDIAVALQSVFQCTNALSHYHIEARNARRSAGLMVPREARRVEGSGRGRPGGNR